MNINNISAILFAVVNTSDVMRIIRIVCIALLALLAVGIIVCVFLQPSASEGIGALSGQGYDTFFNKNKGKTFEGTIKRITIAFSIAIFLLGVLFFITGFWMNL